MRAGSPPRSNPFRRLLAAAIAIVSLIPGAAMHQGAHAQRLGPSEELTSSCRLDHSQGAPALESARPHQVDCAACLLQLQQRSAAPERALVAPPAARQADLAAATGEAPQAFRLRSAATRGPPSC